MTVAASAVGTGCRSETSTIADGAGGLEPGRPPPIARILVERPEVRGDHRWRVERAGLVAVLMEMGLIEIDGVVVSWNNGRSAPGLDRWLRHGVEHWGLAVIVSSFSTGGALEIRLRLSPPDASYAETTWSGDAEELGQGVAEALVWCAATLHRPAGPAMIEKWRRPVSADRYARLLLGRAAVADYDLPLPAGVTYGRLGPLAAALRVDPTMVAAQWLAGRRRLAANDPGGARLAFEAGVVTGGDWLALRAGVAAALSASGDAAGALQAWESLATQWSEDSRFPVARAAAYLDVGEPRVARSLLDGLSRHHERDPAVVALRVDIAEREGPGADYERLLAEWADVDRDAPEPIRRRVALQVREGRLREAYDLLEELITRGAIAEAKTLRMALANDLGRHEDAAREAESLHRFDLARRLRWKARLKAGDLHVREGLPASRSREDSLVAAAAVLPESPEQAFDFTSEVLERDRWDPEALVLRATALQLSGRQAEADESLRKAYFADPALAIGEGSGAWPSEGPSTAAGSTTAGSHEQSSSP